MATTRLAHLSGKLTSQRENAATEAIAFVLNRSEAAPQGARTARRARCR